MRNLVCLVKGHKPYLDYSKCIRPEPDVIVGPVRRYCGRCSETLPGDVPEVGDRARLAEKDALPESHN